MRLDYFMDIGKAQSPLFFRKYHADINTKSIQFSFSWQNIYEMLNIFPLNYDIKKQVDEIHL